MGHYDAAQPFFQILQIRRQAEDRHDLAGRGDVEAVLPGGAVDRPAQTLHDLAQLAVVHVQTVPETNFPRVDAQGIALLHVIIHHGAQQVIGCGDGVQVAGKVQVDILHGHDLRIAAAGSAAFQAEHRPQRGFPQGQHGVFAQLAHSVRQRHGHRGFSFPGGGGVDGRHQHQPGAGVPLGQRRRVHLGDIPSIGGEGLGCDACCLCDLLNRFHFCGAGDFQICRHCVPSFRP